MTQNGAASVFPAGRPSSRLGRVLRDGGETTAAVGHGRCNGAVGRPCSSRNGESSVQPVRSIVRAHGHPGRITWPNSRCFHAAESSRRRWDCKHPEGDDLLTGMTETQPGQGGGGLFVFSQKPGRTFSSPSTLSVRATVGPLHPHVQGEKSSTRTGASPRRSAPPANLLNPRANRRDARILGDVPRRHAGAAVIDGKGGWMHTGDLGGHRRGQGLRNIVVALKRT